MEVDDGLRKLVIRLHEIQCVKFGTFTLKSGMRTPIYVDLRITVSYPDILDQVGEYMWKAVHSKNVTSDVICGVPYGALPVATCISVKQNIPMLFRRKEVKGYGTRKLIEGIYKDGDKCLIVEDVVVSGQSIIETADALKDARLTVTDAVVFLDREQGGKEITKKEGIRLHSVVTIRTLLSILFEAKRIDSAMVSEVDEFLKANQCINIISNQVLTTKPNVLTYAERATKCDQPVAKMLFSIIAEKETNVALAADVTTCKEVLELADRVGPYICLLKTHVEILQDFSISFIAELQELAKKHNFLLYEDHKFSDIGVIVQQEYENGFYRVVEWAHLTNVHPLAGPAAIDGLKNRGIPKQRACFLIAEMSSSGSLWTQEYVDNTIRMGELHSDFVIGFVCQSQVTTNPSLINIVSGIKMEGERDELGQQYLTPLAAITKKGADILVVGRGIWNAPNPAEAAQIYQKAAFEAHKSML